MNFYENYILKNTNIASIFWYKDGMPEYKNTIKDNKVKYILNSDGLRSEEFVSNHENKLHILFAGCSITCGIGVNIEDTWAYKLYKQFDNTSGFFNISIPGASIIEIIINILKYTYKYGIPDNIFILLPPIHRDSRYINNDFIDTFIYNNYLILEKYCNQNNIKLMTTSWAEKSEYQMLEQFNTFFKPDLDNIDYYGEELYGEDGVHPGASIHEFWYNQFKDNYENTWNK